MHYWIRFDIFLTRKNINRFAGIYKIKKKNGSETAKKLIGDFWE